MNSAQIKTPVGLLRVSEAADAIVKVEWAGGNSGVRSVLLKEALSQIEAYFAGDLDHFDLPLNPEGSHFQQQVHAAMLAIPMGETRTYGEIADELGVAAQPVGQACGANPIPIIIPCHRVVATAGLGGFSGAGGVETKIALLRHERAYSLLI